MRRPFYGRSFKWRETREATVAHRGARTPAWLYVLERRGADGSDEGIDGGGGRE